VESRGEIVNGVFGTVLFCKSVRDNRVVGHDSITLCIGALWSLVEGGRLVWGLDSRCGNIRGRSNIVV